MKKEILPAVAAAIFDNNGAILLQKRKDVNQWCLISGHVEFGETVENAILREIFEETNVKASIKRFIGVYSSPPTQTYHYTDKTVQYITSYFEAQLEQTIEDDFSNEETGELKFFPPENIPEELAMMNPDWLNDALDREGTVFIR
jgi:8-oxo-dGTP pyrophosphatase MutT (NUDIX family)